MRHAWRVITWSVFVCAANQACGTTAPPGSIGPGPDSGVPTMDSGGPTAADAGAHRDASTSNDAATSDSGSPALDGSLPPDAQGATDASPVSDGTVGSDATLPFDAGMTNDGSPTDAGDTSDAADAAPVIPTLLITPAAVDLTVTLGTTTNIPTQQFGATYGGMSVVVSWASSAGQVGLINGSGVFTPAAGTSGTAVGGTSVITATALGQTAIADVTVTIHEVQNGDPSPSDAGVDSAGGYGGVGGDGVGDAATDGQASLLGGTPLGDAGVKFLYPYDQTVFPRGLLAPLLQWDYGTHSGAAKFTALRLHLHETNYDYTGYFQVQSGASVFKNQPIPQAVWDTLTYSNTGEPVAVELTFLDGNGVAWGPITESWLIAPGTLKGTIYYNSYGTNLAKNYSSGGHTFGGATLGIKPGAAGPSLVAGSNTECRVCHTVSANGAALFTQDGSGYGTTSAYSVSSTGAVETTPGANNGSGILSWPGLYPDGTLLISNSGGMAGASTAASALYAGLSDGGPPTGTLIPSTGLNGLGAFTPVFSPNGAEVAFNYFSGPLADAGAGDKRSIAVIGLTVHDAGAADAAQYAFSNGRVLWTPDSGVGAYFPSYLPAGNAIVAELQTKSNGRDLAGTRASVDNNDTNSLDGAHGELWIVDRATGAATRLDRANGFDTDAGIAYIPSHDTFTPNAAAGDVTLNYEPTVNPIPSGGYAWVIFTSRRLYGNVATVNPFWSDVRYEPQIETTPTPKKLWVAAVDMNPTPGKDPSHPAFYLPGQELMAGNSRGYWVVSPCQQSGTSCASGDECCGGFCAATGDAGLTCTAQPPPCATEYDSCSLSTPCCSGTPTLQCINNRCSTPLH